MLNSETRELALARLGRALADPTRRRLLLTLVDRPGYPAELAADLGLSRSNVSNHLSCLRGCGLVVAQYEGRQVRYELADPHLGRALAELLEVVLAVAPSPECEPGCATGSGDAVTSPDGSVARSEIVEVGR
ncbi:MAG TPA: metalloregulator ArsR/SmtB family transcription factor [Pseudonocardia sp.]|jgi:DNA-binding transcriptional ArsR family regulator|nr:metalloregulator ArsR/SmtB family transcription factor [Pseudonocardia sp.]